MGFGRKPILNIQQQVAARMKFKITLETRINPERSA